MKIIKKDIAKMQIYKANNKKGFQKINHKFVQNDKHGLFHILNQIGEAKKICI
jgi:hypothetical protein